MNSVGVLATLLYMSRPSVPEKSLEVLLNRLRGQMKVRSRKRFKNSEIISIPQLAELFRNSNGRCYYTGLEFSTTQPGPLYLSVDRIDNSKGYVVGNVALCCWFVNVAKNEWDLNQMKSLWYFLPQTEPTP